MPSLEAKTQRADDKSKKENNSSVRFLPLSRHIVLAY